MRETEPTIVPDTEAPTSSLTSLSSDIRTALNCGSFGAFKPERFDTKSFTLHNRPSHPTPEHKTDLTIDRNMETGNLDIKVLQGIHEFNQINDPSPIILTGIRHHETDPERGTVLFQVDPKTPESGSVLISKNGFVEAHLPTPAIK